MCYSTQVVLDTKVVRDSARSGTDGSQLPEREEGESQVLRRETKREGDEEAEELVYVHNPKKTVGQYSMQQPLLPSVNLVSVYAVETLYIILTPMGQKKVSIIY